MKKIMFNDRYGLTQAVIEGRKTVTRRVLLGYPILSSDRVEVASYSAGLIGVIANSGETLFEMKSRYKLGEVVAVAQNYVQICQDGHMSTDDAIIRGLKYDPGMSNKMYVRADLMPYRIRITGIRCELLQDISDEDCLAEGVATAMSVIDSIARWGFADDKLGLHSFETPREAFAALIDRVSGKGTWERNPWVVVYKFELLKAE